MKQQRLVLSIGFVALLLAALASPWRLTLTRDASAELTMHGNLSVGGCVDGTFTEVDDAKYMLVGGKMITIMFEPSVTDASEDAQISLYSCMDPNDDDSCEELWFDSDFDGAPDDYILTGSSWPFELRRQQFKIAGYLGIVANVAPVGTDVAKWMVCGEAEGL